MKLTKRGTGCSAQDDFSTGTNASFSLTGTTRQPALLSEEAQTKISDKQNESDQTAEEWHTLWIQDVFDAFFLTS